MHLQQKKTEEIEKERTLQTWSTLKLTLGKTVRELSTLTNEAMSVLGILHAMAKTKPYLETLVNQLQTNYDTLAPEKDKAIRLQGSVGNMTETPNPGQITNIEEEINYFKAHLDAFKKGRFQEAKRIV